MTKQEAYRKLLPIQKEINANNNAAQKAYSEGRLDDMCTFLERNGALFAKANPLSRIMVGLELSN